MPIRLKYGRKADGGSKALFPFTQSKERQRKESNPQRIRFEFKIIQLCSVPCWTETPRRLAQYLQTEEAIMILGMK